MIEHHAGQRGQRRRDGDLEQLLDRAAAAHTAQAAAQQQHERNHARRRGDRRGQRQTAHAHHAHQQHVEHDIDDHRAHGVEHGRAGVLTGVERAGEDVAHPIAEHAEDVKAQRDAGGGHGFLAEHAVLVGQPNHVAGHDRAHGDDREDEQRHQLHAAQDHAGEALFVVRGGFHAHFGEHDGFQRHQHHAGEERNQLKGEVHAGQVARWQRAGQHFVHHVVQLVDGHVHHGRAGQQHQPPEMRIAKVERRPEAVDFPHGGQQHEHLQNAREEHAPRQRAHAHRARKADRGDQKRKRERKAGQLRGQIVFARVEDRRKHDRRDDEAQRGQHGAQQPRRERLPLGGKAARQQRNERRGQQIHEDARGDGKHSEQRYDVAGKALQPLRLVAAHLRVDRHERRGNAGVEQQHGHIIQAVGHVVRVHLRARAVIGGHDNLAQKAAGLADENQQRHGHRRPEERFLRHEKHHPSHRMGASARRP